MDVDANTKDFIAGLKTIIRTSWPTQEEFAEGVTSKVNLSNVLRGKGGTSYSMRKALAQKAGMSVDAVMKIGRAVEQTPHATLADILPRISADRDETEQLPFGGSINDIMTTASEFTLGLQNNITSYAKSMLAIVRDITTERDKLVELLAREQLVCNTMDEAIKLVSKDKRTIYANRSMMEKFQDTPGDDCTQESCLQLLDEVLGTGKVIRRLVIHDLGTLFVTGYPITDRKWQVTHVLIVVQMGDGWMRFLQEQGWTPPPTTD